MTTRQDEILAPVPKLTRFLTLGLLPDADPSAGIRALSRRPLDPGCVIGVGAPLAGRLGKEISDLTVFPALSNAGLSIPSTQGALWLCLGGDDAGQLMLRARSLLELLGDAFCVDEEILSYRYASGRDLTGYEDGTENPKGEAAARAAFVQSRGPGLDGGSFVAVQRWIHELPRFEKLTQAERNHVIGRHHESNDELADAPESAHVKRAAQESYEPTAFMLRRSMPWGDLKQHGLYFVAYGSSLSAYERVLRRMLGLDDGTTDALFRFTRPVTGGYYFCPPTQNGKLDLSVLGF